MKTKTMIMMFVLLVFHHWCNAQFVHVNLVNNDAQTRAKLALLLATLKTRQSIVMGSNTSLLRAIGNQRAQLSRNYSTNSFDRKDNFLTNSIGSASLGLGTMVLTEYPSLPYMSRAKREYLEQLSMDKAIILSLQYLDASKIKASHRQQIYRLRGELIRQFSKNDQRTRKELMLSLIGLAMLNSESFGEFKTLLESIEIVL